MFNMVFICLIQDTANVLFNATVTYHAYKKICHDQYRYIMLFIFVEFCFVPTQTHSPRFSMYIAHRSRRAKGMKSTHTLLCVTLKNCTRQPGDEATVNKL